MKSALFFIVNLVVGAAVLAFVLRGSGTEALALLLERPSIPLTTGFLAVVIATVVTLSLRWGIVLQGLGNPLPLARLVLFRSAAHGLAILVPSGKLGGDPLRAWLATRSDVSAGGSIASVAVDRTLEIGAAAPFSLVYAGLLFQHGVVGIEHALISVVVATLGLLAGSAWAVMRLRRGLGLVTSLARSIRLDRLFVVRSRMNVVEASEASAAELISQPSRLLGAFLVGLLANLLVVLEFFLLLAAFGLPTDPIAVVAAMFATGAAHMLPVPAGVGVLEGAQMWLFGLLGYPSEVGLAVGLAVRIREFVWILPGLLYLAGRSLGLAPAPDSPEPTDRTDR